MQLTKRELFGAAGGVLGAALISPARAEDATGSSDTLPNLAAGVAPITREEHLARLQKAQRLMRDANIAALLLESGSSLLYFTGINWWRSERFTGAVVPADGDTVIVTPAFEEPSIRESLKIDAEVRAWNEDENPFALVAGALADSGLQRGDIAIEETVRYFIADGIAKAAQGFRIVPGAPIVRACRMIKSPAELTLMQAANDITLAAFRIAHGKIEAGMRAEDIGLIVTQAMTALGAPTDDLPLVLLNEASAYPHGSVKPQKVVESGVILLDGGVSVHGYKSDISRSWVHGEPTKKQREIWKTVKHGQALALETMKIGVECGHIDDVVRAFYVKKGYGPGYRLPGTPHRLGHGIGMDGHEPVNFVHGEKTPLAPGMCFSDEPGIYVPGEFGIRLEDCLYMTAKGPKLFTALAPSIDKPFV